MVKTVDFVYIKPSNMSVMKSLSHGTAKEPTTNKYRFKIIFSDIKFII